MKKIALSGKAKTYLQTVGFLVLLFITTTVTYRLAVSQVPRQRSKLSSQLKKEQVLRQKSELLRTFEKNLLEQADLTSFALPNKNSSFTASSQLKRLAAANAVIMTNLRISGEAKDGAISTSDLSFDVEGPPSSLFAFFKGIGNSAPIMLIDKIQMTQTQDVARATVRAKVYWADFPSTLPAVSEPMNALTKEEEEILTRIIGLTPPDFVDLTPQAPTEKTNPF